MTLRLQDAVLHVQETLRLSGPDAATYVHLCTAGPSKVSDLAQALGLHRNDVYRSLDRLSGQGLVETTLEKPARFLARDPLRAFDDELSTALEEIESLRASREQTLEILRELKQTPGAAEKPSYRIVQGRQEISAHRRRMLSEASEEILLMSTSPHDLLLTEFDGSADAILSRKGAAPEVRSLFNVAPALRAQPDPLAGYPRIQMRNLEQGGIVRFLLVDDHELLMNVVNDPGHSLYAPDEVALLTTASGLVEAERAFFEQSWARADPLRLGVSQTGA